MKTMKRIFGALVIASAMLMTAPVKSQAQVSVSFQVFYDQLSPYGQWMDYPEFGYVWVPRVSMGFSPYCTGGHWVWTNFGWTWVSDYAWGWAPFHYGRWDFDPLYGWIWIPGTVWAPAWVVWRSAPGYYGWAPMGYGRTYVVDRSRWVFIPQNSIDRNDLDRYVIDRSRNTTIINNSVVINNNNERTGSGYNAGPDRNAVERVTGRKINTVTIHDDDRPGQSMDRGQLNLYRPVVQKNNANGVRPAPAKVMSAKEVQQQGSRNSSAQNGNVKQQQNSNVRQPANNQKIDTRQMPRENQGQHAQPRQKPKLSSANQNSQQNGYVMNAERNEGTMGRDREQYNRNPSFNKERNRQGAHPR